MTTRYENYLKLKKEINVYNIRKMYLITKEVGLPMNVIHVATNLYARHTKIHGDKKDLNILVVCCIFLSCKINDINIDLKIIVKRALKYFSFCDENIISLDKKKLEGSEINQNNRSKYFDGYGNKNSRICSNYDFKSENTNYKNEIFGYGKRQKIDDFSSKDFDDEKPISLKNSCDEILSKELKYKNLNSENIIENENKYKSFESEDLNKNEKISNIKCRNSKIEDKNGLDSKIKNTENISKEIFEIKDDNVFDLTLSQNENKNATPEEKDQPKKVLKKPSNEYIFETNSVLEKVYNLELQICLEHKFEMKYENIYKRLKTYSKENGLNEQTYRTAKIFLNDSIFEPLSFIYSTKKIIQASILLALVVGDNIDKEKIKIMNLDKSNVYEVALEIMYIYENYTF